MNATEIAYLEARIEEERYRKVQEADEAYRRDMEALEVVRGLYERYGELGVPEEGQGSEDAGAVEPTSAPMYGTDPNPVVQRIRHDHENPHEEADPPDAGGAVEEEQRVEAGEPEPEPVQPEEPAEPEIPEGFKLCKRCGPVEGPKPIGAFGRHNAFADKRDNRCKECRREMRFEKRGQKPPSTESSAPDDEESSEVPPGAPVASSGPPMRITVLPRTPAFHAEHQDLLDKVAAEAPKKTQEPRLCANGEDCMSVKHTGEPTRLNSQNKGTVCFGCAERDKALGRPSPDAVTLPIVRKSQGEDRGEW